MLLKAYCSLNKIVSYSQPYSDESNCPKSEKRQQVFYVDLSENSPMQLQINTFGHNFVEYKQNCLAIMKNS